MITQRAADEVAVQLHADVAIGHQVVGQRTGHEADVGGRLQALDAERRLELAGAQLGPRVEARIDVGVLDHGAAVAEIGREAVVDEAGKGALDDRAHAGQGEGVGVGRQALVVEEVARVGVDQPAQADAVVLVPGLQREALLAGDRHGLGRYRGRGGLLVLYLQAPLHDAHVLGQRIEARGIDRGGRRGRRRRRGRDRRQAALELGDPRFQGSDAVVRTGVCMGRPERDQTGDGDQATQVEHPWARQWRRMAARADGGRGHRAGFLDAGKPCCPTPLAGRNDEFASRYNAAPFSFRRNHPLRMHGSRRHISAQGPQRPT